MGRSQSLAVRLGCAQRAESLRARTRNALSVTKIDEPGHCRRCDQRRGVNPEWQSAPHTAL
jgi:hypothetical protein